MFWTHSSELALLHSVWITRLINMILEQDLNICDPHFSQIAAIAATLHLYHSEAADETIRNAALVNLGTCRAFVRDLGHIWPLARQLNEDLDRLIHQSSWHRQGRKQKKLSLNTSLMWTILGYNPPTSYRSTHGIFHRSMPRHTGVSDDGDTALGSAIHNRQAIEICRPDRNEATSPTWDHDNIEHDEIHPTTAVGDSEIENSISYYESLLPWINDHHTLMETECGDFHHAFNLEGGDPKSWEIGTL